MGRTLNELSQSMPASELLMWMEYDRINPISDRRGDIQAAQITSAIYNSHGCKVSLEEAILQWNEPEERDSPDGLESFLGALAT